MFICQKCLDKSETQAPFPPVQSHGQCEVCGDSTVCHDVKGEFKLPAVRKISAVDVLPRTRTQVIRSVPTKKDEVAVTFSAQAIADALIDKYGESAVGPEATKIPRTAKFENYHPTSGAAPYFRLVWDEPQR